jgi:predicted glycoside hydrolase/deacetylase ChbG (UPF0249 family)
MAADRFLIVNADDLGMSDAVNDGIDETRRTSIPISTCTKSNR